MSDITSITAVVPLSATPSGGGLTLRGVSVGLGLGESIDLVGSITGLSWTWFAE
jgi:hypothetical protein